jgi:hypothetical protein
MRLHILQLILIHPEVRLTPMGSIGLCVRKMMPQARGTTLLKDEAEEYEM